MQRLASTLAPFLLLLPASAGERTALDFAPHLFVGTDDREPASAQLPLGAFAPSERGERWRSAQLPHPEGAVELLLESVDAGLILWVDADRDGALEPDERFDVGDLGAGVPYAKLELTSLGLLFELFLYVDEEGRPSVTAMTRYHFEQTLEVDGEAVRVAVLDADLSGTVSAQDRWIVLHGPQLDVVRPGGMWFAANLTDEPWYLGQRTLRLGFEPQPALTLGPAERPRHEFLAERAKRVQAWFFERYDDERAAFLEQRGIRADRPVDPEPPAWHYAWDLEEALAVARAEGRPLWVQFTSDGCPWCMRYPWLNERDAEVTALLRRFTLVKIARDLDPAQTAAELGLEAVPSQALFDGEGQALLAKEGWYPPVQQVALLEEALELLVGR